MTGLADTISQLTELWPALARALARDAAAADAAGGRAFERADIIALAIECDARYSGSLEPPYTKSFADRLTELPADWPAAVSP